MFHKRYKLQYLFIALGIFSIILSVTIFQNIRGLHEFTRAFGLSTVIFQALAVWLLAKTVFRD